MVQGKLEMLLGMSAMTSGNQKRNPKSWKKLRTSQSTAKTHIKKKTFQMRS